MAAKKKKVQKKKEPVKYIDKYQETVPTYVSCKECLHHHVCQYAKSVREWRDKESKFHKEMNETIQTALYRIPHWVCFSCRFFIENPRE